MTDVTVRLEEISVVARPRRKGVTDYLLVAQVTAEVALSGHDELGRIVKVKVR